MLLLVLLLALSQLAVAADAGEGNEADVDVSEEIESDAAQGDAGDGDDHVAGYALVKTSQGTLNMRSRARSNASVVARLPNNALVRVLEFGEEWSKVAYGSKTGFVLAAYLEETDPPSAVESGGFPSGYAQVNTGQGTLNMRSRARDNASVVARLPNNALVQVLEFGEIWSKVTYGAKTGFVLTAYLEEAESPGPEPEPGQEGAEEGEGDGGMELGPYAFAKVNTTQGTLNMRSQARDGARVVGRLSNGMLVHVHQRGEKWSRVSYGSRTGYVMSSFLVMLTELPYQHLQPGDTGAAVRALKERMKDLGYLTRRQVNDKFCADTEKALRKLEMLNGMPETGAATPELQAFVFHGSVERSKSGYSASNTHKGSGLTVSIFAWTSGYTLLGGDDDGSVEVIIHYVTNVSGGSEPYTVTVRNEGPGDSARNPYRINWSPGTPTVYLTATATDDDGNTVSARVRVGIQNVLPDPYAID